MGSVGPIGRLGHYTATHFRFVVVAWIALALVLGFFAPRVETALSGAGWETTGSQSVQARQLIDKNFQGLSSYGLMTVVHSPTQTVRDPAFSGVVANVERTLRASSAVTIVVPPAPGVSISPDGHTAIVQAGAARSSNGMVAAADGLKGKLASLSGGGVQVHLTGAAGMWSDFNTANRNAMLKSEVISWPVTLGILLIAFGSLVAAGLPLMLTMLGLLAAAGSLYLSTKLMPVSIWAMNFALMFALALGIDYALFVVHRFRGAFFGSQLSAEEATAVTMDTAGKAVLFSGVTVLISLTAVMLVPSPAFRSMSLGIMLAVIFVLAATLTLLPAVLAKLGPRVDKLSLKWVHSGEHRSARFAAWGERLWRQPVRHGVVALAILAGLAIPITQLKTSMPSIKVVPTSDSSRIGYQQVQAAFGPGSTGPLQIVTPSPQQGAVTAIAQRDAGIRGAAPDTDQRRLRADHRDPQAGPVQPGRRRHDQPPARRAPDRDRDRRRGRREPRPAGGAERQDATGDRRRSRPRVPALADRAPSATAGGSRCTDQPARDRRRIWRRQMDLPGRRAPLAARLPIPRVPRRLGTGVLLRDDLRDLDGLHRVPALQRQGALGPHPRPA